LHGLRIDGFHTDLIRFSGTFSKEEGKELNTIVVSLHGLLFDGFHILPDLSVGQNVHNPQCN
jgi:ABC-type lipoprotein export system ATPase subunit